MTGWWVLRRVQAVAIFGFLTILLLRQISDPDIWAYLVVAREMISTHTMPAQEFYLFPVLGEPAIFSALGYGLLHYVAYMLAGYGGMAVVNALLIAGALTILVWTARPREASTWEWPVVLCVLAGAYACLHFRTFYRPESTLYLFLALEMLLLECWLIDGNNRRLLWLPLLTWGIAQLHTTAVLLVLVYGAYVMHWALGAVRTPLSCAARQAALLIAVGAAMLALPIINPNGIEQVLLLVRSTGEGQHLVEYLPVWSMIYRWHFLALALVAVAAWLLSPERRNVDLALLLGFGWLAFRYNRNLGLFALMAIVPVTRTVLHYATRRSGSITLRSRRWIAAGFVIIGVAGLIAVTWRGGGWGVGIREGIFPEKAVDVIRRVSTGGNVMNFYPYGGFLA